MFVGHFAIALAAKPLAPKVSLVTLILAAALVDVLGVIFLAAGIEQVAIEPQITAVNALNLIYIPFSHSLLMHAVWGGLFAALYFWLHRDRRGAWVVFAAVASHWLLDFVSHRPDMPLAPGLDMRLGLGLWNSQTATFIVEGAMWFGAVALYARSTRANRSTGVYGFWTMIVLLTAMWVISLRGDPPPNLRTFALANTALFLIVEGWAYWMDMRRPVA